MPSKSEQVELLIGGKVHADWESYEIDSDLLTPADGWFVSLGLSGRPVPPEVETGASIEVRVGGDRVMVGRVDDSRHPVGKKNSRFSMNGRDGAAILLESSAPIFTAQQVTLDEVVAKVVKPLGIKKVRIDAAAAKRRAKVSIEPGESAWDALLYAAEANGLWPWFEPDGTLVVGGPDYTTPVVAELVMRKSGKGNNLLSLDVRKSARQRYSEVTVLGQAAATDLESGINALKATVKDTGVGFYKPRIICDSTADSVDVCRKRARKCLSDSRLNGLSIEAMVKGHRIVAPGTASDGLLWKPGQRVRVISEPHGLDGIYFMMGRRFVRNRSDGTASKLTMIEDGAWVPDAHPRKGNVPAKILDVPGPVA